MSEIRLTDENPSLQMNYKGHKKPITDISFQQTAQQDKQFASSSEDHSIIVWNGSQNVRCYNYVGHTDVVTGIEYTADGKLLASCSKDTTVRFWVPTLRGGSTHFKADTSAVLALCFSPESSKLLTGSISKTIKLWDTSKKQFISSFVGHNNWVRCVRFSPDGKLVASCSDDRTVRIWDVVSGECINVFPSGKASPNSLAIHRNSNSVAVAMNSGSVRVYDVRNKKLQQHYDLHDNATSVSWHPQANYLLTSGKDGKLRIVDVMEGRPLYTLSGHEGAVNSAKFNYDGTSFASGGSDNFVMVWKTNFISET